MVYALGNTLCGGFLYPSYIIIMHGTVYCVILENSIPQVSI